MNPILVFLSLLFFLFLLSRTVSQSLGQLILKITKSKNFTISALAFTFLPGTIIHEFSHAAVAQGLGVYVGEIDLTPKIEGNHHIKLGSVQVAQCDPLRRFLIGTAPLIVGILLIVIAITISKKLEIESFWPKAVLFYLLFQIGNTMFSSKKDIEGAMELIIAVLLVFAFLYLIGFNQVPNQLIQLSTKLEPFVTLAKSPLQTIIALDIVVIVISKLITPTRNNTL